jgi:hypothetical protein
LLNEKKLNELRIHVLERHQGITIEQLIEVFDTIEALWKVGRAAELLSRQWHDGLPHRVYIDALDKILDPLHSKNT